MRITRLPVSILFILLPIFLLSTPSYASMGDISICFPFFLLLALLMAGMLAQGRSPLVGFDISISKPPAEIKSTSYKFKSFTSGGFDSAAKARNEMGGGSHITRGVGWILDKTKAGKAVGKVAGKAASAVSGGKYGTDWTNKGANFTKNMSKRGILHAATGGRMGGGYLGTLEREKKSKDTKVKSLREQLGYASAGKVNLVQAMSRIKELQNKKASGKKLKGSETRELNKLRELVGARAITRAKKKEVRDLGAKVAQGQQLTPAETARLNSLRTELGALEKKYAKATTRKSDLRHLSKEMRDAQKKSDAYNVAVKQMNRYVESLDTISTLKPLTVYKDEDGKRKIKLDGRFAMMAYAPAAAAGFTYLGAKYPVASAKKVIDKRKTKKELQELGVADKTINKRLTKKEISALAKLKKDPKRLETLRKKDSKTLTQQEKDDLILNLRGRYQVLSRPSALSTIFNPRGEKASTIAKIATLRYGKRLLVATPYNLIKENIPANQLIATGLKSYAWKPGVYKKLESAEDKQSEIQRQLETLKNPGSNAAKKREAMKKIRRLEKDLKKEIGTHDGRVVHRVMLSGNAKKLEEANKKIKEKNKEIDKLLKGKDPSKHRKAETRAKELEKLISSRDELLFGDTKTVNELDTNIAAKQKLIEDRDNAIKAKQQNADRLFPLSMGRGRAYKKNQNEIKKLREEKKSLEKERDGLISQKEKILSKTTGISAELATIAKADRIGWDISEKKKQLADLKKEKTAFELSLSDLSMHPKKRLAIDERLKEIEGETKKLQKEVKKLEKERKKLEGTGEIPTRRLAGFYGKLEKADRWVSDQELILGSSKAETEKLKQRWERESSIGTARLVDMWGEKVNVSKGHWNAESLAIRALNFSKSGIEETQKLRHIASTWENVIAPMLIEVGHQEAKRKNLERMLGKQEDEARSKREKIKGFFSKSKQQGLYEQRRDLEREVSNLAAEAQTLKVPPSSSLKYKEYKAKLAELESKKEELRNTNRKIADARMQLSNTERNIGKLTDSFLIQEALRAGREIDYVKESTGDKTTREFKDKMRKLETAWEEAAKKTEIRVGGEAVLRDRDRIRSELTLLKGGALDNNAWNGAQLDSRNLAVSVINKEKVSNKNVDYYAQHKDEYATDLKKAYSKLKDKWDNLQTVTAAKFVRDKMNEVGDNRRGRESGLSREMFEMGVMTSGKEFEKLVQPYKDDIKAHKDFLESRLYLNTLEFGGVIDIGTATKYDKKIDKIEKQRMNVKGLVEADIQDLEKRIDMVKKGELKEAKDAGWTKEAERIKQRVNDLEARKEKLENCINQLNANPFDEQKERDKYKKLTDDFTRTSQMHRVAELLQREDYAQTVGGLMQVETKKELEFYKTKYPSNDMAFWNDANEWAGRIKKQETASALDTYERNIVNRRKEIKTLSSKMYDIESKYDSLSSMSDVDRRKYAELSDIRKEKQNDLRDTLKEWKGLRTSYSEIYEGPERRADRWMGPKAERNIEKHLKEYAEDDVSNRLGIWGAVPERFAEPVSKAVEHVTQFGTKHGAKVLLAAAIATPFAMPFIGIGAAVAIAGGAAGTYGVKTLIRKEGEWEKKGHPLSHGDEAVTRMAYKVRDWSSHLTGRGSGAPAKYYNDVWRSSIMGNEYISKGMRLDAYGRLQPDKEAFTLPQVGLPWFIRIAKTPMENVQATTSYWAKRTILAMNWPGSYEELRRVKAENPSLMPEISERIQYQYIKMYGSLEPIAFPKQAHEISEFKALAMQFPYQEYAKGINPFRTGAPNPLLWSEKKILKGGIGISPPSISTSLAEREQFRIREKMSRPLKTYNPSQYYYKTG